MSVKATQMRVIEGPGFGPLARLCGSPLVAAALFFSAPTAGFGAGFEDGLEAGLETGGDGVVAQVIDGDTLILEDGAEVRLVGIQAPKLALGRPNFPVQPSAEAAKSTLEKLVLGHRLRIAYGGTQRDRHGRVLAHLFDSEGRWIQGEMVARGMARVYSFADNRARMRDLLILERAARAKRLGLWANQFYQILSPTTAADHIGSFEIVEGEVVAAAVVRGRAYLNFGPDRKTDFTVSVAPRDRRRFEREGIDLGSWAGKRIRVRGWIKLFNGPLIDATHPEQIELLD
jgi:endonuclease YncB( thermonuclease family)